MPAYLPQGRLLRGSVEQWLAHPRIQQGLQCPNCWLKALAQACSGGTHLHQSEFIIIPTNSPLIAHRLSCVRSDQSSRSFGCQAPIKNLVYTDISGLNTCRKTAGSRMKKHWKILNENVIKHVIKPIITGAFGFAYGDLRCDGSETQLVLCKHVDRPVCVINQIFVLDCIKEYLN